MAPNGGISSVMDVEYLDGKVWKALSGAGATHVEANHYGVVVPVIALRRSVDELKLRVDGKESYNTWEAHRSGFTVTLEVLVED